MKNIHLIPTPNPSRLGLCNNQLVFLQKHQNILVGHKDYPTTNQTIYITNDEEIKEGDLKNGEYYLYFNKVRQFKEIDNLNRAWKDYKKIILTTDGDLTNDGVQAIPDEFLKWFVKNPSCEEVELDSICKCTSCGSSVKSSCDYAYKCNPQIFYKIIIPKEEVKQIKCYCGHTTYCDCSPLEEPKQETLEEAALRFYPKVITDPYNPSEDLLKEERTIFIEGAKWQQEQDKNKYSEEDMLEASKYGYNFHKTTQFPNQEFEDSCIRNTQQWFEQFKKK